MLFYLVIFQTLKQARQNVIRFHLQIKGLRLEDVKGLVLEHVSVLPVILLVSEFLRVQLSL